jgi:hypothetical protein
MDGWWTGVMYDRKRVLGKMREVGRVLSGSSYKPWSWVRVLF